MTDNEEKIRKIRLRLMFAIDALADLDYPKLNSEQLKLVLAVKIGAMCGCAHLDEFLNED